MRNTSLHLCQLLLCYLSHIPCLACAQTPGAVSPQSLCLGYDHQSGLWGGRIETMPNGDRVEQCPEETAYFAVNRESGPERGARYISVRGNCCPVPPDLLLDKHTIVEEVCPEGSVATGGTLVYHPGLDGCMLEGQEDDRPPEKVIDCRKQYHFAVKLMRCTMINTERYQLADPRPARLWGTRQHLSHGLIDHVQRARIPAAIRHAVGRDDFAHWRLTGCIGYPFGSLLTEKRGKRCDFRFRQLQYRGNDGDPKSGTAVQMYPECKIVSSRFDPNARCIK